MRIELLTFTEIEKNISKSVCLCECLIYIYICILWCFKADNIGKVCLR